MDKKISNLVKILGLSNVKGSPKTTIVGSIVLAFSFYLLYTYMEKDYSSELYLIVNVFLIVVGILLLFLKDKKPLTNESDNKCNQSG